MSAWMLIWKLVFFAALILFAGMAVWVTIGGVADLMKLFRSLKDDAEASQGDPGKTLEDDAPDKR